MKGIVQLIPGDLSSLVPSDNVSIPQPSNRQMLIRVDYCAVNRLDLLQGLGKSPVPAGASNVLGLEVSGIVSTLSEGCTLGFKVGEKVMALLDGGGYAEFCVADERHVFRALPGLTMQTLCAIPEAFITAYQLCFFVARIQPGDSVLLHAAASSVGQAAIQLLVRKGITVYATVRSKAKQTRCLELGAEECVLVSPPPEAPASPAFCDQIKGFNDNQPVDVVLCPVGSEYLDENLECLGMDGRLVLYGTMGGIGIHDDTILRRLMGKRIQLLPSTLRSRSDEYKGAVVKALLEDPDGIAAIASGETKVYVDRTHRLEEVVEAHRCMGANQNIGKIVMSVASSASAIDFFQKELDNLARNYRK